LACLTPRELEIALLAKTALASRPTLIAFARDRNVS
jgi:hypothetical protein